MAFVVSLLIAALPGYGKMLQKEMYKRSSSYKIFVYVHIVFVASLNLAFPKGNKQTIISNWSSANFPKVGSVRFSFVFKKFMTHYSTTILRNKTTPISIIVKTSTEKCLLASNSGYCRFLILPRAEKFSEFQANLDFLFNALGELWAFPGSIFVKTCMDFKVLLGIFSIFNDENIFKSCILLWNAVNFSFVLSM